MSKGGRGREGWRGVREGGREGEEGEAKQVEKDAMSWCKCEYMLS